MERLLKEAAVFAETPNQAKVARDCRAIHTLQLGWDYSPSTIP
ncbi:MAG: hypothetical protein ACOX4B_03730 [Bacillota bacterium]